MHIGLVDGPFSLLDGIWRFVPLPLPAASAEASTARLQDRVRAALRVLERRPRGGDQPGVRPHRQHLRRFLRPPRRAGPWTRADGDAATPIVRVAVACSPSAGRACEMTLDAASAGRPLLDAIRASGAAASAIPSSASRARLIGIWGRACAPETRAGRRRPGRGLSAADDGSEGGAAPARQARAHRSAALTAATCSRPRSRPGRGVVSSARCLSSRNSRSPLGVGAREADAALERAQLRLGAAAVVGLRRRRSRSSSALFLAAASASAFLRFASSSGSAARGARGRRGGRRRRREPGAGCRRDAGRRAPARRWRSGGTRMSASGVPAGGGRSLYWTWPPLSRHFHCASAGRAIRLAARSGEQGDERSGHGLEAPREELARQFSGGPSDGA